MSKSHTMFFSYNFMGRKPVLIIKYGDGKVSIEAYKTVCNMPADLRHQYRRQRLAHHMMSRNK